MPTPVSDARSNANDQIAHAARVIGKSKRRQAVFDVISKGKRGVKTVSYISEATGLSHKDVLTVAKHLVNNHLVSQVKTDAGTGYEKDPFLASNRVKILVLAGDPQRLEALPTKTNPRGAGRTKTVTVRVAADRARVQAITVDDLDSFAKVRSIGQSTVDVSTLSEAKFKKGVQQVIGEKGKFTDWGGETSDLWSTRARLNGRRVATAFAFKGPGQKGKLTPAKLGKNGDQIQRLFQSEAQVFFVQYWGQIDESVLTQMRTFAIVKAIATGQTIYYGVIDGHDTARLVEAYRSSF